MGSRTWRWRIGVDRNIIHTETGYAEGTLQKFTKTINDKFKAYKRAKVNANAAAQAEALKMIREKLRSGFVEFDTKSGIPAKELKREMLNQWDELPETFRVYRKLPLYEVPRYQTKAFQSVIDSGSHLTFELPPGRQFTFLITDGGRARVYSMRQEEYTLKFPHLVKALERSEVPPRTLFTAFVSAGDTTKDHTIFQSKTVEAMVNRQLAPGNRLHAVVDDIYYWNGEDVISNRAWRKSRSLWDRLWPQVPYFAQLKKITAEYDQAKRIAEEQLTTGVIIYDRLDVPNYDHCLSFQGSRPYNQVWLWRRGVEEEFYLLYHPSIGGRTGIVHKRNRSDESCMGKVGLYKAGVAGDPLCYGTVRHGFSREDEAKVLELAEETNGWVGKGVIRYRGYQEATHSNVVTRLVDPYFLRFLPDDPVLDSYRELALAPGLGTHQGRERRAPSIPSSPAPDSRLPNDGH
jgi:hypothetical protein